MNWYPIDVPQKRVPGFFFSRAQACGEQFDGSHPPHRSVFVKGLISAYYPRQVSLPPLFSGMTLPSLSPRGGRRTKDLDRSDSSPQLLPFEAALL